MWGGGGDKSQAEQIKEVWKAVDPKMSLGPNMLNDANNFDDRYYTYIALFYLIILLYQPAFSSCLVYDSSIHLCSTLDVTFSLIIV